METIRDILSDVGLSKIMLLPVRLHNRQNGTDCQLQYDTNYLALHLKIVYSKQLQINFRLYSLYKEVSTEF